MKERIAHTVIALDIVEGLPQDEQRDYTYNRLMVAQVHATLALVEAQHAANEIAERAVEQQRVASMLTVIGDEDPETVREVFLRMGVDPVKVRADIAAALGWS